METVVLVAQVVVALGIFNVWLLRSSKATAWRGGDATTMPEEFEVYGLPQWFMRLVGFAKLALAALLIVAIWVPWLAMPAAAGMGFLMIGAVVMHFKVGDPPAKSLPAFTIFLLCVLILVL